MRARDALDNVAKARRWRRNHEKTGGQVFRKHPARIPDAGSPIHDEAKWRRMEHFAPLRLEAFKRSNAHVAHVVGRHLAPAHGQLGAHDVRAQVRTRHAQNHLGYAQVCRALGLLHRQPDRPFQPVEIDHGARADTLGRLRPRAGHARLAIRGLGTARDHAGDL